MNKKYINSVMLPAQAYSPDIIETDPRQNAPIATVLVENKAPESFYETAGSPSRAEVPKYMVVDFKDFPIITGV